MSNFYDKLCETFIRPFRQTYNIYDLGQPVRQYGKRIDFHIYNNREHKLMGSFYSNNRNPSAPCIVYLHSLNGSRLQSLPFVDQVLAKGFNFCCFDFSGTGQSQGQYVSLGFFEKYDIKGILDHLSNKMNMKSIYLWGRSMGAAAAIKFMSMHNSSKKSKRLQSDYRIDGLVFDSPFQSLSQLTIQLVKQKINIPQFFIKGVLMIIQSSIQQKAGFKISDMELLQDIKYIKCPVLLLTSKDDKLVLSSHSQKIYDAIPHKDKQIMFIKGQHNSNRDASTLAYIIEFILKGWQTRKMKLNSTQTFIKSSKALSYKVNNLAGSIAVGSKSFKKINNISFEGPRFDTTADDDLTFGPENQAEDQQNIKWMRQKQYKKAINLYFPIATNKVQRKQQFKNQSNIVKSENFIPQTNILKISTDTNLNKNQKNLLFFDQNYQQKTTSQKKICDSLKNQKVHIEINKSPIKMPPKLHEESKPENQNKVIFVTPEKKVINNKKIMKQSLHFSEQKEPKKFQIRKQVLEDSNNKMLPSFQVNHFNVINQKLKKKKKKAQPPVISPRPNLNQDYRIATVSLQRKSQLSIKPHPQVLKPKNKEQFLWKNQHY